MGEPLKWQEYKCHKVVQAVKITEAVFGTNDGPAEPEPMITIIPSDSSIPTFKVTREWWHKRTAEVGGYCVLYSDGYMSWSPAKEFEDGYTKMDGGERPQLSDGRTKAWFEHGTTFQEGGIVDIFGAAWWCNSNGKLTLCEIDPVPDPHGMRGIGWAVKQMHGGHAVRRKSWPVGHSVAIVAGAIKGVVEQHADILAVDWTFA